MRTRFSARALRLLLATVVALGTLAFEAPVHAAVLPTAVPMCSEDGRSIAAPPIMRANSDRVLESRGDCERLRALLTRSNRGDHQRGGAIEAGDAPLRAVPARAAVPESPCGDRIALSDELGQALPARTLDVFRPPRP